MGTHKLGQVSYVLAALQAYSMGFGGDYRVRGGYFALCEYYVKSTGVCFYAEQPGLIKTCKN